MNTLFAFAAQIHGLDDGLAPSVAMASLPTDPASLFVLLLAVVAVGAVIWFGRPNGKGGKLL